jgi:hypothetical protein
MNDNENSKAGSVHLVVTSIAKDTNFVLKQLAKVSLQKNYKFIIIGDKKSPPDFQIDGCAFYSLEEQKELDFEYAKTCPEGHYARKNIGYLLAMSDQASVIIETDDDNLPYETFWEERKKIVDTPIINNTGWVNVYRYFTEQEIWPRGFPLELIKEQNLPDWNDLPVQSIETPIQQGLANENPDVDAVYRLTFPLPLTFKENRKVALSKGAWCPFNSQNTTWWREAYPLMYLPAYCSFRMTDIWRSFIAQRIAWTNGWSILFHQPTVWQERNEHNLIKDFEEEVSGYLNNQNICQALEELDLKEGINHITDNMRICYEKLVEMKLVLAEELNLLELWLNDVSKLQ